MPPPPIIIRALPPTAVVLALAWLLLFVQVTVTTFESKPRGVYFSENALSPNRALPGSTLADLQQQQQQSTHHFPSCSLLPTQCHVLFPIEAGDRREAIAVVANAASPSSVKIWSALSQGLSRAQWLSKSVLFILAPNATHVKQWLEAYDNNPTLYTMHRAGPIRGAVIIDVDSPPIMSSPSPYSAILVQGANGQQCNMDLLNVAVNAFTQRRGGASTEVHLISHDFPHTPILDRVVALVYGNFPNSYVIQRRARSLWRYALQLIFGPSGWHGIFISRGIDAITLQFRHTPQYSPMDDHLFALHTAESLVRTLSNIDERLHQSFFLYLMQSPLEFVSVEEYMWPLVLFCFPLAFLALQAVRYRPSSFGGGPDAFVQLMDALAMFMLALIVCFLLCYMSPPAQITSNSCTVGLIVYLMLTLLWRLTVVVVGGGTRWECIRAMVAFYLLFGIVSIGVLFFPLAVMLALVLVPSVALARPPPLGLSQSPQWCIAVALAICSWAPFVVSQFGLEWLQGEFWGTSSSPFDRLEYGRDVFGLVHWYVVFMLVLPCQYVIGGILLGVFGNG